MLFEGLMKTSLIVCLLLYVMIQSNSIAFAEDDDFDYDDAEFKREMIAKYPGYFYTVKEVNAMEEDLRKMDLAVNKGTFAKEGEDVTDGRTEDTINHACCSSETSLVPHKDLIDTKGKPVRVVQLPNYKQVFHTETCQTVPNCDCCYCTMTNITFTAVVYKDSLACCRECMKMGCAQGTTVTLVLAPAVCRCLNRGSHYRPSRSSERIEL